MNLIVPFHFFGVNSASFLLKKVLVRLVFLDPESSFLLSESFDINVADF